MTTFYECINIIIYKFAHDMRVICGATCSKVRAVSEKEKEMPDTDGSSRENYLVRIYRRDKADPDRIAGLVEFIEAGEKKAFATFDGLKAILAREHDKKRAKQSNGMTAK